MITNKLCSPFLLICLSILLFVNCSQKKQKEHTKDIAAINRQLEAAANTTLSFQNRLNNATKAFDNAVKRDSAYLVWMAFSTKYSLLQTLSSNEAMSFLNSYQKIASHKKDTMNTANALFERGKRFTKDQPDSAYFYFNASRILCEARKDSLAVVEKLTNMAYMHHIYNDFAEFENITTEGLKFLPITPKTKLDSIYLSLAYNNYGLAYSGLYEFENADKYYHQALALNSDPVFANSILNNLGLLYMREDNFQKAANTLSETLKSKSLQDDPVLQAKIMDNLGYCLFKLQSESGFDYLQKAERLREKSGDVFGTVASAIHLAEYYQKNDKKLFEIYARKAYRKATDLHSTNDRLSALRLLLGEAVSDHRTLSVLYIHVKDSIDRVRQKAKNQFTKIKYDSKLSTEENLKLKTKQAQNNLQIEQQKSALLVILLVAFGAIGITIYIYLRTKIQTRKTVHNVETRIAKQLHDELANDLHHAMSFADSSDLNTVQNKETLLQNLEKIYERTRNISKENQDIDTGTPFPMLLKAMIGDYNSNSVNVISSGIEDISWKLLSRDKKITVHRIVQEWLVNMKKHSNSNIVVLKFEKLGSKVRISYKDNGVGLAKKQIILKGGLQNMENRIQAIKGTFIFDQESETGFHAVISFPI